MKENLKVIVGERLGDKRTNMRLLQKDLAELSGVSAGVIHNVESARNFPSMPNLMKLADAMNTSTDYLLGRTDIDAPIEPQNQIIGTMNGKDVSIGDLCAFISNLPDEYRIKILDYLADIQLAIEHKSQRKT